MALPEDRLSLIMDSDYTALGTLLNQPAGVNYNIGLATLTRTPKNLEQVPASNMPWLLQTDGRGESDFRPSSQVSDRADLIYLGYCRPDAARFPDLSCPEIRRGIMADIQQILDIQEHRVVNGQPLVFDRARTWESFDDPNGEWSLFVITESVFYHRSIGS